MSESTKKSISTKKKQFNSLAIDRLHKKWGVTKYFIRESIKGERTSETSEKIKKEYYELVHELEKVLKQA